MEGFVRFLGLAKPYAGIIFVQIGYAGMAILAKSAFDKGMSQYVFVVYRQAFATLVIAPFAIIFERKARTKMTFSLFFKILMLTLLEPVIDQNLYFTGMKLTTATFTAAIWNILPALAFLMAWACRLEKVNILKRGSQAKIIGTIVTVGGAMIMTFITGPMLNLPWTNANQHLASLGAASANHQDPFKGFLMIATACISWSAFIILQAITLKSYPAEMSLTALVCFLGVIGSSGVALIMDRGNLAAAWALHFDSQLLAVVYAGVICSGATFYIQGVVMQTKGPVFVTAFSPVSMILIAILSSFILSEIMFLGRIIGAVTIIIGLYLVLWGKSKDKVSVKSEDEKIKPCDQQQQDGASKMVQSSQEFAVLDIVK